jgi:hypothetical protein
MNYPLLYIEHLSQQDIRVLAETAGLGSSELERLLRDRPGAIDELLALPALYDTIFEAQHETLDRGVSTFLAFGALVNRSARDLQAMSHVAEWSGPGKRLPVFDVEPMRAFLEDGLRRFFLIEFLNSFTSVASGSYMVKTRTGFQRRRFNELDLGRMAEMVELLPPIERAGGYRRLGDIALFLSGVFPDHAATHPLPPTQRELVASSAAIKAVDALIEDSGLRFLDTAGAGWYRRAADETEQTNQNGSGFLRVLSDRFSEARRILNYMADRYLFHRQLGWLGGPG